MKIKSTFPSLKGVQFRTIEESDADYILHLRLDPQLSKYISPTTDNLCQQKEWLGAFKEREQLGQEFYYIISLNEKAVGCVRLYDFRNDSFCWGSWIIERGTCHTVALRSMAMVYDYGYLDLNFTNCHFDVRKENLTVNKFHERTGAKLVSSDDLNNYYIYSKTAYLNYRNKLLRLASVSIS